MPNRSSESDPAPAQDVIPLLEEQARLEKREVVTGRVRVSTRVETFEEIAHALLRRDDVEVTRVAIGTPVEGPIPQVRTEGDVTIVPVLEEVLFVETRLVLKEELHIRKRTTTEQIEAPVTLRRQRADVERLDEL